MSELCQYSARSSLLFDMNALDDDDDDDQIAEAAAKPAPATKVRRLRVAPPPVECAPEPEDVSTTFKLLMLLARGAGLAAYTLLH